MAGVIARFDAQRLGSTGWLTIACYLAAAAVSVRACRRLQHERARRAPGGAGQPDDLRALTVLWVIVAIVMCALPAMKLLQVQTSILGELRSTARAHGWYSERRPYQAAAILVVVGTGLAVIAIALSRLRRVLSRAIGAIVGTALLLSFVTIRAISLHRVDSVLYRERISYGTLIELGGIGIIAVAAVRTALESGPGPVAEDASQP